MDENEAGNVREVMDGGREGVKDGVKDGREGMGGGRKESLKK